MKTTTIFWAYVGVVKNMCQPHLECNWRSYSYQRQLETFRTALLRRMEAGDNAREELAAIKASEPLCQDSAGMSYLEWLESMAKETE